MAVKLHNNILVLFLIVVLLSVIGNVVFADDYNKISYEDRQAFIRHKVDVKLQKFHDTFKQNNQFPVSHVQANEKEYLNITCENNGLIFLFEAKWQYDLTDIQNFFTPNWRNFAFLWGRDVLGFGRWDVTGAKILQECKYHRHCNFLVDKNDFEKINYRMYLQVKYSCVPLCHTTSRHARIQFRRRQPPTTSNCVHTTGWSILEVAAFIEMFLFQNTYTYGPNDSMGSIISMTRQPLTSNARTVELVHVVRARIDQASRNNQGQDYPAGIAERMQELQALVGDERGHIIADCLGGPRSVYNFFPQARELDRPSGTTLYSPWHKLEMGIRNAVDRDASATFFMTVVLQYDNPEVTHNYRPVAVGLNIEENRNGIFVASQDWYFKNNDDKWIPYSMEVPENWF